MNSSDNSSTQAYTAAYPSLVAGEEAHLQEVSHVFHCMQCDLEFQMDMASSDGSHEKDAGIVLMRLNPHVKQEQGT